MPTTHEQLQAIENELGGGSGGASPGWDEYALADARTTEPAPGCAVLGLVLHQQSPEPDA